jgi:hypothetical protein
MPYCEEPFLASEPLDYDKAGIRVKYQKKPSENHDK